MVQIAAENTKEEKQKKEKEEKRRRCGRSLVLELLAGRLARLGIWARLRLLAQGRTSKGSDYDERDDADSCSEHECFELKELGNNGNPVGVGRGGVAGSVKERVSDANFGCPVDPPVPADGAGEEGAQLHPGEVDYFAQLTHLELDQLNMLRDLTEKMISSKRSPSTFRPTVRLMISYCRSEALEYALQLKKCLIQLSKGQPLDTPSYDLTVYLDVHEISLGCDWADCLNEAVRACDLFVCLVTPSYGKTLWTSRELKLADQLDKFILPVNFSQAWPPEKLSIQLATRQFISWHNGSKLHKTSFVKWRCWLSGEWLWPEWRHRECLSVAQEILKQAGEKLAPLELTGAATSELSNLNSSKLDAFRVTQNSAPLLGLLRRYFSWGSGSGGSGGRGSQWAKSPEEIAKHAQLCPISDTKHEYVNDNDASNDTDTDSQTQTQSESGSELESESADSAIVLSPTEPAAGSFF